MINVRTRRLNPCFYEGPVSGIVTTQWEFGASRLEPSMRPRLEGWARQMRAAIEALSGSMLCEGALTCTVNRIDCIFEGNLYLFDDTTLARIDPYIQALYDAARLAMNACTGMASIKLTCTYRTESVLFKDGNRGVAFAELDTEPVGEPSKFSERLINTPMAN